MLSVLEASDADLKTELTKFASNLIADPATSAKFAERIDLTARRLSKQKAKLQSHITTSKKKPLPKWYARTMCNLSRDSSESQ